MFDSSKLCQIETTLPDLIFDNLSYQQYSNLFSYNVDVFDIQYKKQFCSSSLGITMDSPLSHIATIVRPNPEKTFTNSKLKQRIKNLIIMNKGLVQENSAIKIDKNVQQQEMELKLQTVTRELMERKKELTVLKSENQKLEQTVEEYKFVLKTVQNNDSKAVKELKIIHQGLTNNLKEKEKVLTVLTSENENLLKLEKEKDVSILKLREELEDMKKALKKENLKIETFQSHYTALEAKKNNEILTLNNRITKLNNDLSLKEKNHKVKLDEVSMDLRKSQEGNTALTMLIFDFYTLLIAELCSALLTKDLGANSHLRDLWIRCCREHNEVVRILYRYADVGLHLVNIEVRDWFKKNLNGVDNIELKRPNVTGDNLGLIRSNRGLAREDLYPNLHMILCE